MLGGMDSAYNAVGPFYGVELNPTQAYFLYLTTPHRAIAVTGTWGWHDDYANAWITSNLTVSGSLSASATTITPSADPTITADLYGNVPGISAGALIQIDNEWMQVLSTASTPTIGVARGQNGTTAAIHSNGAAISVYQPCADIEEVVLRWAAFIYAQDSVNFSTGTTVPMGATYIQPSIPNDILTNLQPYMRGRVA